MPEPQRPPIQLRASPKVKALFVIAMFAIIIVSIVGVVIIMGDAMTRAKEIGQVRIVVTYDGQWSGSYGNASSLQSWNGTGTSSVVVAKSTSSIGVIASAQKKDGGVGELTISIQTLDGKVLDESSTTDANGMAQVAVSF